MSCPDKHDRILSTSHPSCDDTFVKWDRSGWDGVAQPSYCPAIDPAKALGFRC